METAVYVSVADTAKLIRTALKGAFPSVKFSVQSHSYAGGASVNVSWVDGPLAASVEMVAKRYQGAHFDGRDDSMHYHTEYLVGEDTIKAMRYGADFVFCTRKVSPALGERALGYLRVRYGQTWPDVRVAASDYDGTARLEGASAITVHTQYLDCLWNQTALSMTPSGCIVRWKGGY